MQAACPRGILWLWTGSRGREPVLLATAAWSGAGCSPSVPACQFYPDLVGFLEYIFLNLLHALKKICRDFKWLCFFKANFHSLWWSFILGVTSPLT